jgi:hypothetical protein
LLPGETPKYVVPDRLGPPIRDVGGSWITAEWLLQSRFNQWGDRIDKNYGRTGAQLKSLSRLEGTTDDDGPDERPSSSIPRRETGSTVFLGLRAAGLLPGSKHQKESRPNDADTVDFLRSGGWHIRKAGATGAQRGRPVTGITGREYINAVFEQIIAHVDGRGGSLKDVVGSIEDVVNGALTSVERPLRLEDIPKTTNSFMIVALLKNGVNNKALARLGGRDPSTLRRYRRTYEQWIRGTSEYLPANSPKGGRTEEMSQSATIIERLDRIERLESMRAETMDHIRQTLDELAARFLNDERVQVAVEDFLADAF